MTEKFAPLLRRDAEIIIRAWVDEIHADRHTDLAALLSYRELAEHLPELLDELAFLLDTDARHTDVSEAARRLRFHAQTRVQQGCLIDEVARELMTLRAVLIEYLWREGIGATQGDIRELSDALRRTDAFVDELIAQTVVIYAASLRPPVRTRSSVWPPPRRRKTDFPPREGE